MKPQTFYDAVDLVNDVTEHRYGSGPIEDGGSARTRAIKAARAVAKTSPHKGQILAACNILEEDA